ncbi:MAG: HU family DNA-binding protein [Emcibacteraceae bacterium]|nr:HU family DNA-binding protein [Emcibacteraceae bacterium]
MKKLLSVLTIGAMLFSVNSANAMNKAELIDAIAEKTGIDKKEARMALNVMLAEIETAVARGERVMLPKFGVFAPAKESKTKGGIFIPDNGFGTAMKVRASVKKRGNN